LQRTQTEAFFTSYTHRIVSDHANIEDQQHGLELGATDYITKPFDASDFVSRILSHINHTPVNA